MDLAALGLRQRDGVSCGPAVAVVAGALLDPDYRARLTSAGRPWFLWEQGRVHAAANRIWPRALGTTPSAVAKTITAHGTRLGVGYGWRLPGRRTLTAVERAVASGLPVAMLVGRFIPRHWVLVVEVTGRTWHCYEPSSGEVRPVSRADVLEGRLAGVGFPRVFAFVLPHRRRGMASTDRSNI